MKRLLLIILFTLSTLLPVNAFADDVNEESVSLDLSSAGKQEVKIATPKLNAMAAIIMDMNSGRVLYEKNARIRKPMASTTKIMTAIVAIENSDMEEEVTVSKRAADIHGSKINLKTGEKLKMGELLYGLMLQSGNDAAIAIAEHVGGSVENFCEMMNKKAEALGAVNTHFTSPHGLDMPEHYTTAYELAKITSYGLRIPFFNELVSTKSMNIPNRTLSNTNELLGSFAGVDGVKTGYTGQAGRCLVTSATRNQMRVISVVLGSPTRTARAQSSSNLLNYAFTNYKLQTLALKDQDKKSIPVDRGISKSITAVIKDEIKLPLREDEKVKLEEKIELPNEIEAPIEKGQELGSVSWVLNGEQISKSSLIAKEDVRRKNFYDYFKDLLGELGRLTK